MAPARWRSPLRIHVENSSAQPEVFHVTPERYEAVLARFPELRRSVSTTFGFDGKSFDADIRDADVLMGFRIPTDRLFERAPRLKWIHLTGAGLEHLLPLDWLPSDVLLTTSSGAHAEKAGEFVKMALLMLNNQVPLLMTSQRARRWSRIFSTAIGGKTVLVVGVGGMGTAAAKAAKSLGLRVLGVRRSGRAHRQVDEMYRPADLHEVLPRADFIVLTLPFTAETKYLLGRDEFAKMKPGVGVLNMARAGVLDNRALIRALRQRTVSGAIIDVFDQEPLPRKSPLWDVPNLVITPHCSSDDAETYAMHTVEILFDNVKRYLAGRSLRNRVDVRLGY